MLDTDTDDDTEHAADLAIDDTADEYGGEVEEASGCAQDLESLVRKLERFARDGWVIDRAAERIEKVQRLAKEIERELDALATDICADIDHARREG
jgi:acyl-CoA reductase-like NAD-dependent aldehyde dehydrogenase